MNKHVQTAVKLLNVSETNVKQDKVCMTAVYFYNNVLRGGRKEHRVPVATCPVKRCTWARTLRSTFDCVDTLPRHKEATWIVPLKFQQGDFVVLSSQFGFK